MASQDIEDIPIEVSNIINEVVLPDIASEVVPIILPNIADTVVPIILPNIASEEVPIILQNVASEAVPLILQNVAADKVIEKMIIESLVDILSKKISDSNANISLSKESSDVIKKIIELSPSFLNDIEKSIVEIIKDDKIDANDIPNLILIIQKLYELIYKNKDIKIDSQKQGEICADVLKFIVHTLVLERKINIDQEKQAVFFELIDKLIDSCISLISFQKTIKIKGCLKSIFG